MEIILNCIELSLKPKFLPIIFIDKKKLNISKNLFENFPEEIFELKSLKTLWINNLNIKTFPTDIILEKLNNLKAIYCFGKLLDFELIDNDYIKLSKIKGLVC